MHILVRCILFIMQQAHGLLIHKIVRYLLRGWDARIPKEVMAGLEGMREEGGGRR